MLVPALAAAVVAAVVGFGAYVVSASAGLNEPPVVAAVSRQSLGAQAGALARSRTWTRTGSPGPGSARGRRPSGRIVALASSTVDGTPALLVYTRSGATTLVTVVTGCDERAAERRPVGPGLPPLRAAAAPAGRGPLSRPPDVSRLQTANEATRARFRDSFAAVDGETWAVRRALARPEYECLPDR